MAGSRALNPEEAEALRRLIKFKVHKFLKKSGQQRSLADDLEQELAVKVLERLPKHDPGRATLATFLSRIVDNLLVDLERHRTAQKRNSGTAPISLDAPTDADPDRKPIWQTLPDDRRNFSVTGSELTAEELAALRLDLAALLATMPTDHRALCELRGEMSVTEAAEELGIARGTAYRHWQAITDTYQDHDLQKYFE